MRSPLFCPRASCRYHQPHTRRPANWYLSAGTYTTRAFGTVRRFRCRACGAYFSAQTFSLDYYAKRTLSYRRLLTHLITTSSIRDMSRDFGVSTSTVGNKISRLARNCLAVLQLVQQELPPAEQLCADGFESYTLSKYFPCHINLLAGLGTQTVYWFDYVTLRRKGRMSEEQRKLRAELEKRFRADPKGLQRSFRRLFEHLAHLICDGPRASTILFTDKHPAYRRARRRCFVINALRKQGRFAHRTVSSSEPRDQGNPLFSVNYLDRQLHKDLCEHVRKTVCHGRNVSCAMDRLVIYLAYHNLYKAYREVKGDLRTHAEVAGLERERVMQLRYGLFARRAFLSRVRPEGTIKTVWLRRYVTPLLGRPEYVPAYARAGA